MIDLNDKVYLDKLKKAVSSNEGRIIIEYLKLKLGEVDYSLIKRDKPFEEIGRDFAVCYNIKEELGKMISFLTSLIIK